MEALLIRLGFLVKGFLKGSLKSSSKRLVLQGFGIGTLMMKIGVSGDVFSV